MNSVLESKKGFNFIFRSDDGPFRELGFGSFEDAIKKMRSGGKPVKVKRVAPYIGYRPGYNIIKQLIVNSEGMGVAWLVTASDENAANAIRNKEIHPSDLTHQMT